MSYLKEHMCAFISSMDSSIIPGILTFNARKELFLNLLMKRLDYVIWNKEIEFFMLIEKLFDLKNLVLVNENNNIFVDCRVLKELLKTQNWKTGQLSYEKPSYGAMVNFMNRECLFSKKQIIEIINKKKSRVLTGTFLFSIEDDADSDSELN